MVDARQEATGTRTKIFKVGTSTFTGRSPKSSIYEKKCKYITVNVYYNGLMDNI